MNDDKFKDVGLWIGGILAAIVAEAVLVKLAHRCLPGLFPNQQQQKPQPTRSKR